MKKELDIIVQKLKQIPHCEGIIFAGSRAEGDHNKKSDYDFTVLIDQGKSYFEIFWYKGLLVDVLVATAEVMKKTDLVRTRMANPELGIMAHGEILYDKSGKFAKLQKLARSIWKRGPACTKKDKDIAGHLCVTLINKLEKDKEGEGFYMLTEALKKTIPLFFQLHGQWQPKYLKVEGVLKAIDPVFHVHYQKVAKSFGKKRTRAMIALIKYLITKFSLPTSGEVYLNKEL